jgi:hypothetical protein
VLPRAAAETDLKRVGLAVAARTPVLVEDAPAKAMELAVAMLEAALLTTDRKGLIDEMLDLS